MYFYRDTAEKIPWAVPVLCQFRFLDTIVNVDTLTANIEQLLETCPMWFQHELILFLPDILLDTQHQSIAEILTKIMEENSELMNVILNCIASFNLSKEYLMEYKSKVLNLLKTNVKLELIPTIIRYISIFKLLEIYLMFHYYCNNVPNNIADFSLMTLCPLILSSKCYLYYAT